MHYLYFYHTPTLNVIDCDLRACEGFSKKNAKVNNTLYVYGKMFEVYFGHLVTICMYICQCK